MNIGAEIKRRREAIGLTQLELADKLGVSRPLIAQYERGSKQPTMPIGYEIAAVFGCTVDDLYGREAI